MAIVRIVLAAALGLIIAQGPHAQTSAQTFAMVERLDAELLATRSATATLESWCREHRMADPPQVTARLVAGAPKPATPEQLRRLDVSGAREVKYRHVRLHCGSHVLSDADNWYVPARLTAEMNRLLDATDTPFGKAVAALEPTRETIAVRILWHDTTQPIPDTLFEHRAVLYTKDREPFSEVDERYRRELLDWEVR